MTEHDPNRKGDVAELAIAAEAARLGLTVLMPMTEHERYDLVLGIASRLYRVQCKWARKVGDVIAANLTTSRAVRMDTSGPGIRRRRSTPLAPIART